MTKYIRQCRGMVLPLILYFAVTATVQSADYIPGELYVKYASSAARATGDSPESAIAMLGGYDIRQAFPVAGRLLARKGSPEQMARREALASIRRVRFSEDADMVMIARKLSALPAIEYAEPVWIDHVCLEPNDSAYTSQGYLDFVNAPAAWDIATGDSSVVIAIIDTGTDWQHPDLAANVWTNPGEIPGNGLDDDGNEKVDDVHGWDFYGDYGITGDADPSPRTNNHGTHVAGIAAAVTNNNTGVASLSYNVRYMPLKAGPGNTDEIFSGYEAMLYAADAGADIINCSWGSLYYSFVSRDIVETVAGEGVLIVAAAGNENTDIPFYPASYPAVFAVGAIDLSGDKSYYSNYGTFVDIAAPGDEVLSTVLNGSYAGLTGTSMAAPVVSALAALILSGNPDYDIEQVQAQMLGTAVPLASQEYLMGAGYIDAEAALGNQQTYIVLKDVEFSDSTPNNDGIFRPGEIITARLDVRNIGAASGTVTLSAQASNGYVTPLFSSISTGSLSHGEEASVTDIQFMVNYNIPTDAEETIRFTFTFANDSTSTENVRLLLNPSYATFAANTLELSFNAKGNIGYADYPTNASGSGFIIHRNDIADEEEFDVPLLFEAGFMIGMGPDHVSDVVRGDKDDDDLLQNTDLTAVSVITFETVGLDGSETGTASFTDSGAGTDAYGVTVDFTGYASPDSTVDQCVILSYLIRNTGLQNLTSLRAGLFFDFDVPVWSPYDDYAYYIAADDIIAVEADTAERLGKVTAGIMCLQSIETPALIPNDPLLYDGFTEEEKWLTLGAGNTWPEEIFDTDISIVAAAPAFDLPPGSSHRITYILGYGLGYDDLKEQLANGKSRAADIISMVEEPGHHTQPSEFGILGAYPNPFNPATIIEIASPAETSGEVVVYAVTGQKVRTLVSGTIEAGYSSVRWDGCDDHGVPVAAGVYLIRFSAAGAESVHRVTLLK